MTEPTTSSVLDQKLTKDPRLDAASKAIRQRRYDILSFVLTHVDNRKLLVNTNMSRIHVFDLFQSHCPISDIRRSSYFFKLFYKSLVGFIATTQHYIRIKVIELYHFKKEIQLRLEQTVPDTPPKVVEQSVILTDDALKEAIAASKYTLQEYYDSGVTNDQLKRVGVAFSDETPATHRQRPIMSRTSRHGPYVRGLSETEIRMAERRETSSLRLKEYTEQRHAKARKRTQQKRGCKQVVAALLSLTDKPPRVQRAPLPVEQTPVEKAVQQPLEYSFTTHKENGTFGFKIHALNSTVRIIYSKHPEIVLPSQIVKINDSVLMSGTTLLDVQKTMRTLNNVTLRLKPVVARPSILKKRKFQQPLEDYSITHTKMKPTRRRELFNHVLKAFNLNNEDDNVTAFTRDDGISALETIVALKKDLIENFQLSRHERFKM